MYIFYHFSLLAEASGRIKKHESQCFMKKKERKEPQSQTKHRNLERDEKQIGIKLIHKLEQTEETQTQSGMSMLVKKRGH